MCLLVLLVTLVAFRLARPLPLAAMPIQIWLRRVTLTRGMPAAATLTSTSVAVLGGITCPLPRAPVFGAVPCGVGGGRTAMPIPVLALNLVAVFSVLSMPLVLAIQPAVILPCTTFETRTYFVQQSQLPTYCKCA